MKVKQRKNVVGLVVKISLTIAMGMGS